MVIRSSALVPAVLARRRTLRRHDRWTPAQLRAHQDRDVLLARPREVDPEARATRLRSALTVRGAVAPAVWIQTVDAIPRTPLGKAPLIVGPAALIPP